MAAAEEADVVRVDAQLADSQRGDDRQRQRHGEDPARVGAVENAAIRRIGPRGTPRAARLAVSGFIRLSSVGTNTSEIMKSTMIPIADPMPNDWTATTLLVASDTMPSAVVALAPNSGAARCATVALKACFRATCRAAPRPSAA